MDINELFEKWYETKGEKIERTFSQTDESFLKYVANIAYIEGYCDGVHSERSKGEK